MRKTHIAGVFCAGLLTLGLTTTADAALLSRLPATPGGTDYQAYYDTTLDITWVADANLAASNTFGVSGIWTGSNAGVMNWTTANNWIAGMNTANYLGFNDWRLPTMIDTGASGCDFAYSGTDCGYYMQTGSAATTVYSEMASLWYDTLGNTAQYNTSGSNIGCPAGAPGYCLTNIGPFSNLQPNPYWFGVEYAPNTNNAWVFSAVNGGQSDTNKDGTLFGWAVRTGDVNAVPVPAAVWLFGSGLIGLLGVAKRKS
jgi:hypothetical protein